MNVGATASIGSVNLAAGLAQLEAQSSPTGAMLIMLDSSQVLQQMQTIATNQLVNTYA